MPNKVVIFTANNARILHVPETRPYEGVENVLINPDLTEVRGLAPHYWQNVGGKVVPLDPSARAARDTDLDNNGCINALPDFSIKAPVPKSYKLYIALGLGAIGAACLLAHFFF